MAVGGKGGGSNRRQAGRDVTADNYKKPKEKQQGNTKTGSDSVDRSADFVSTTEKYSAPHTK